MGVAVDIDVDIDVAVDIAVYTVVAACGQKWRGRDGRGGWQFIELRVEEVGCAGGQGDNGGPVVRSTHC